MVYLGKASLSCKNCRIRRIKCNKVEPECTQCVRAGKTCPGYRDQLSLMFRDETVRVRQKFGDGSDSGAGDAGESASEASPEPLPPAALPNPNKAWSVFLGNLSIPAHDTGRESASPEHKAPKRKRSTPLCSARWKRKASAGSQYKSIMATAQAATAQTMIRGPIQTPVEQGLHFYLKRYLYVHPVLPDRGIVTAKIAWILDPTICQIASSVGLAGLANLTGSEPTRSLSWQHYMSGLQVTSQVLRAPTLDTLANAMRCVVLMAQFEIVRNDNNSSGTANTHVLGAAALLQRFLPHVPAQLHPFRGLLQICLSLLPSLVATTSTVPPILLQNVTSSYGDKPKDDQLMAELLFMLCEMVNLHAHAQKVPLADTTTAAVHLVGQALALDARLAAWEQQVSGQGIWRFDEFEVATLPPEACFQGRFQRYSDISTSRIWNYYRWGRLLTSKMLLGFAELCPAATSAVLDKADYGALARLRTRVLHTISTHAEAVFVSTSANWRHPSLSESDYANIATPRIAYDRSGGTGVLTLVPTLLILELAACMPGVPPEHLQWALNVVDTVAAYQGLHQARALVERIRAHRDAQIRRQSPHSEYTSS